jgi:ABC-type nitrate/sulfonate/bicarbonate transport system permease component
VGRDATETKTVRLARAAFVLFLFALLEIAVRRQWISPLFVASPSAILETLGSMLVEGSLLKISGTTLFMLVVTFLIGSVVGIPLGYFFWRHPIFGLACENLLGSLFASPLILLYPIFLVIFGRNLTAIIAQAFLVGSIPIILGTQAGFRNVSRTFIDVGLTLQLTRWQILRHILIPAAAPAIFTGLRVGFIYMLLSIVAMEFVVSLGGIGRLVSDAYYRLNTEELYVGVTVIIVFAVGFSRLLLRGQKLVGAV